jgi:two-component system OmpR family sensor kinase
MKKQRHPARLLHAIPIRWRLTLVSLSLLALLLAVLGIIISMVANRALVTNEIEELHSESQVAFKGVMKDLRLPQDRAFSLGDGELPPGTPGADFQSTALSLLHALSSPSTGTNALILNPDGTTMLTWNAAPFAFPAITIPASEIQQLMSTNNPYLITRDAIGERQLVVFIPLEKNQQTIALLQISTPTAPIDQFLATLNLLLFLGILSVLILATICMFPLVSVALRPLVEIERTSRRIAQGKLSMRIDPPATDDEIGRLARSFNQMIARLEEAFQRQKRFVGDVSHELRTPLTALSGSLEMLLIGADQGNPEATRRLTRGMFNEVLRMHRMVEDLLALNRLDERQITFRREKIDPAHLLTTICTQAEHLTRGQELRCLLDPDLPPICADSDRLQQVLLNVLDNACKYTPTGGLVELHAQQTSAHIVSISVRDTGQGIPAEALPHVFDRFYRADPARSRSPERVGGNGLGLSIARELVEAQGGTITIQSLPGHGTTVTLRFPIFTGQMARAYAHQSSALQKA